MNLEKNLSRIKARMARSAARAGRHLQEVCLLAVTKTVGVTEIRKLAALGLTEFGENRVQDAIKKQEEFRREAEYSPEIKWHLIGTLQTNKARAAVHNFDLIHSLDRWSLAAELNKHALHAGKKAQVLIQVNVSGEKSKHGLAPEELMEFYQETRNLDGLILCGLMTMAPFTPDPEETRPVFGRLREYFLEIQKRFEPGSEWRHLSMGMSNDFEVAIEEGATIIRVGSAIFHPPEEDDDEKLG